MTFDEEMFDVARELLTEFGFPVTIRNRSSSYNTATLTATEGNTPNAGLGAFFDPANSNITGYESELKSDGKPAKWLYVQTDYALKDGDVIQAYSKSYKINAHTSIGPKDLTIFYRVKTEEV